ncbi:diguanylate cyclase domain-containing protein [Caballeronia sp. LZ034LL]|uniref:diguanylate cyclase domain-containing protein n=1 Tax=Caballeronia sp. LZ034LL TaxID=3038567 RepID=UPI00285F1D10|nr:diguanylate cyclase [Caballeronia sp. LZ034LL]MDR5836863.1 diguanylate cyclase [Caballeronia sp. LZ034LL]
MEALLQTWLLHANRRPKLLIADDQPLNIRVLYELLHDVCDIFMATSGSQALQICQAEAPDLILLDVVMDDLDGHEVCRRLKADPLTRDVPVIFITSQDRADDEVKALELGAVDFISKPINPVVTKARVRTHLTIKFQGDLLRASALLDGLTGVSNRRKFDEDLHADWRHCAREETSLALLMVDVDCFKRFNDHYGHMAGDACLKAIAKALAEALRRPYDKLARYGGEEFACLLPKTDLAGAQCIAQRIVDGVHALDIGHVSSDVETRVTISVGVACVRPACGSTPDMLLKAADDALYQAKRAGRARFAVATQALQATQAMDEDHMPRGSRTDTGNG